MSLERQAIGLRVHFKLDDGHEEEKGVEKNGVDRAL